MLGIFLIYFIGKSFFELAESFEKSKWGFAILGVISYYAGTIVGGLFIGIAYGLWSDTPIEEVNEYLLGIMAVPFGLLCCACLYFMLKEIWTKNRPLNAHAFEEINNMVEKEQ